MFTVVCVIIRVYITYDGIDFIIKFYTYSFQTSTNATKTRKFVLTVNVETPQVHTYVSVNRAIRFHRMERFARISTSVKKNPVFVEMVNVQILMDRTNAFVTLATDCLPTDRIA